jgi:YVTN family beta-propeller protein
MRSRESGGLAGVAGVWPAVRRVAAGLITAVVLTAVAAVSPSAAADGPTRDVVFVANAEDGTVTMIDAPTLKRIRDINVIPDGRTASPERDPLQALGQPLVEVAGGENFAQDLDVSPDGRVLYVSRGHLGDVAAFDVGTGKLLWRVAVGGFRADHMTISGDGTRLYVSAMTDNRVEVIDTDRREIVGSFPTGQWPHDNVLSPDGERVYNGSIGNILVPRELRDGQPAPADPALGEPYQLTVAHASSFEVLRTLEFPAGIRPFVLDSEEGRMYTQLSFVHGIVEYDLREGRRLRSLDLPVKEGVTEDDYDFEAPHHGLELSGDGETLCAAGRASDYVALVSRERMQPTAIIEVGDAPGWAANSPDGRNCFVTATRDNTVSVISYARAREVARIQVGQGPKYVLGARVPKSGS